MSEKIITIQKTPRSAKAAKLLAVALAIGGTVVLIVADAPSGERAGALLLGLGVVLFVIARVSSWWKTG